MQSFSTRLGSSNKTPGMRAQAGTGRFMLTLCALAAPVSLRPPRAPQLKPFTFFMSRARELDGSERLYLHMGFFGTLAEAERWAESVRRHYPSAFATIAPAELAQTARPETPQSYWMRGDDAHLSDTQVMQILEAGRTPAVSGDADARDRDQVALLRPEDTGTRRALREAVVQGTPVSFAVQLCWAAQPIDLGHVRSLDAFNGHTLYATETHRKGRSSYFLRLGFFPDPKSAKEVAVQVRSAFASAAVIPVVEPEITRAREATVSSAAIPNLVEHRDEDSDADFYEPQTHPTRSSRSVRGEERLEGEGHRTRQLPDERRASSDSDPLSESGVRHLKVEMQEQSSGRWKVIKLREAAEFLHVD